MTDIPELAGTVFTDFGPGDDRVRDIAVQPWDNKIVVVGESDGDFAVSRYHADGSLDASFGLGGKVKTDFDGQRDRANAVAIAPDGTITVVGTVKEDGNTDMGIARYLSNGGPDFSFSGDGRRTVGFGHDDEAYAVALQPDGKIVVAGAADARDGLLLGRTIEDMDYALVRLNPDGSLDHTFAGDGKLRKESPILSRFVAVTILDDGRIIAGGNRQIYRFHADGTPDASLDGDGKLAVTRGELIDLVAHGDGRFAYIMGEKSSHFLGGLDASGSYVFTATIPFESRALALQSDGNFVIAAATGSEAVPGDFALMRYTPTGAMDSGFGEGSGLTIHGIFLGSLEEPYNDEPSSIAIAPNGKIVVAGHTDRGSFSAYAIARYRPWGALDADCAEQPTPLVLSALAETFFRRGDVDGDGSLSINDAIHFLKWILLGSKSIACDDAADTNDDGNLTLDDAIYSLSFNFLGTAPPPVPFTACGLDITPDELGCQDQEICSPPDLSTGALDQPPIVAIDAF